MTLEEFRINHSTLIEQYQFIEAHLEGIYAAISGKNLLDGLQDVERDSISRVVNEIKMIEKDKSLSVFTDEEYIDLQYLCQQRNFWCHNCYYDMCFDSKTGGPKKLDDIKMMQKDLQDAELWRDFLFEKKMKLFQENEQSLISSIL